MLHEFLSTNQQELIDRCARKVAKRPGPASCKLEYGIPRLIEQLVETLREEGIETRTEEPPVPKGIGNTASKHGNELLRNGFTLDQVVHDYGDLCQAVTELAHEHNAPITVDEFHTFNRCLDNAIAEAVSEFGRQRDHDHIEATAQTMNERLGSLAHELRNNVNTAMLAFHAIKTGSVALGGATSVVLDRSLKQLTDVINHALVDVRLNAGLQVRHEAIELATFCDEASVFAVIEAKTKAIVFSIAVEAALVVEADHQLLSSAVTNLLQNALKFTPKGGAIWLRAHAVADRVLIEVEDRCGGLPTSNPEDLFRPFHQRSTNRTGLGLGLSISRRSIEAHGGTLRARNLPGEGCIFTIDLPRAPPAQF